jgi:group I intron endonuclease
MKTKPIMKNLNDIDNIECNLIGETLTKKDLKHERDTKTSVGIYKIINKINGKYYVGSSKNIIGNFGRWYKHKYYLNKNKHPNSHLQNSWNEYGENNFEWTIVELCEESDLLKIEQKYLDEANLNKNLCYNKTFLAGRVEWTDEMKQKISKLHKGKQLSKNHKQILKNKRIKMIGINAPNYGKKHSIKTKNLFSKQRKGFKNPSYDETVYILENQVTKHIIKNTMYNLRKKYNLNRKCLSQLINGHIKSYRGFICLNLK